MNRQHTHAHELTEREIKILDKVATASRRLIAQAVEGFLYGCIGHNIPLRVAGAALSLLLIQTAVKVLMMCSNVPAEELPGQDIDTIAGDMQELMANRVSDTIRKMERKHFEGN